MEVDGMERKLKADQEESKQNCNCSKETLKIKNVKRETRIKESKMKSNNKIKNIGEWRSIGIKFDKENAFFMLY